MARFVLDVKPGARHHRRADRARHGRRDGHLRPRGRARLRREDRRRRARRGAEQPGVIKAYLGEAPRARRDTDDHLSSLDRLGTDTLPEAARPQRAAMPDRLALREKDRGIWQSFTWRDCHAHVRDFALGLAAVGLKRGDKRRGARRQPAGLYWAQLAAQALGGISVPLYQDSIAASSPSCSTTRGVASWWPRTRSRSTRCSPLPAELPKAPADRRRRPARPGARTSTRCSSAFDEVEAARPRARPRSSPGLYEAEVAQRRGDDMALLAYTSGTTGVARARCSAPQPARHGREPPRGRRDASPPTTSSPSCRWPGWATAHLALAIALAGAPPSTSPRARDGARDLREIGPHVMIAPPRIWEAMCSTVQVKIGRRRSSGACSSVCVPSAERGELRSRGSRSPATGAVGLPAGLSAGSSGPCATSSACACASACTGGAPLGADIFRFFRSFGVNLKQVYGQTESGRHLAASSRDEDPRRHGGRAHPGDAGAHRRARRGPGRRARRVRRLLQEGGGHAPGRWRRLAQDRRCRPLDPRGQLVIIDRLKDVLKLADGTRFSPQFIENKLKFSPYIREAVVVGDDGPSWPPWSRSTWASWATGPSRTACPTPPSRTSPRKPEVSA